MIGTDFFTTSGSVEIALADKAGNAVLSKGTLANLPSAAAGFAVGGQYIATDTGATFVNLGTTATSAFAGIASAPMGHPTTAAINSSGTATAAQVATGYITSTSASPTTITLPTGTLLGAALNASAGTIFEFYVDNTAGASTVTIAVAVNGILSAAAAAGSTANFGLLTVPSGVTGLAQFTCMFSSPTAYAFSRTA